MITDKDGTEVIVGDTIWIPAIVTEIFQGDPSFLRALIRINPDVPDNELPEVSASTSVILKS